MKKRELTAGKIIWIVLQLLVVVAILVIIYGVLSHYISEMGQGFKPKI